MTRDELLSKAKPILFNTEMVRAILEGHKTVTRRVLKTDKYIPENSIFGYTYITPEGYISAIRGKYCGEEFIPLPYQIGGVLYVRETCCKTENRYIYRADYSDKEKFYQAGNEIIIKWKPSRYMPKEAARIFLRVKDVRIEKIWEITVEDVSKEGICINDIEPPPICCNTPNPPKGFDAWTSEMQADWFYKTARASYIGWCDYADQVTKRFGVVWDTTINPKEIIQYGWKANPWVWVIEFERIDNYEF